MARSRSELEQVIHDIKSNIKQTSINKVDEVNVMKSMLNDPNFYIGVYDRNIGYIGQRCPHAEAVDFTKNIISKATGLDSKDSKILASKYEFDKKDATFLLTNMRDFLNVYTSTGRKINLIQNAETEASVYIKDIPDGTKIVPNKDPNTGSREIQTCGFKKLISQAHCPKYKNTDQT
jgi:hypothetical protein